VVALPEIQTERNPGRRTHVRGQLSPVFANHHGAEQEKNTTTRLPWRARLVAAAMVEDTGGDANVRTVPSAAPRN